MLVEQLRPRVFAPVSILPPSVKAPVRLRLAFIVSVPPLAMLSEPIVASRLTVTVRPVGITALTSAVGTPLFQVAALSRLPSVMAVVVSKEKMLTMLLKGRGTR